MKPIYRFLSIMALFLLISPDLHSVDVIIGEWYYELYEDGTCKLIAVPNKKLLSDVVVPEEVVYNEKTYSVTAINSSTFSSRKITSISIPKSVTSIGKKAFRSCSDLKTVYSLGSITSIESQTFEGCSSLVTLNIPNSVTTIGGHAFSECSSLTSITIPNSVTTIGESAFSKCSSLTSVTIPSSVTTIERDVFYDCGSLTSITIPNSVTSIGNRAFGGCSSLTSVIIPNSVTSIGKSAFSGCSSLTLVTIQNSVTTIGEYAFSRCSSLTSVTIPNSVTSIGEYAFSGCSSLTSITIPNSVTTIGESAFKECSSLTSITLPPITTIEEQTFYGCSSLQYANLPQSLTFIDFRAFYGCNNLKYINIPESVVEAYSDTFWPCDSLLVVDVNQISLTKAAINVKHYGIKGVDLYVEINGNKHKLSEGEYIFGGINPTRYLVFTACRNDLKFDLSSMQLAFTLKSDDIITASSIEMTPMEGDDCEIKGYWRDSDRKGKRLETGLDPDSSYKFYYVIEHVNGDWRKSYRLGGSTKPLTLITLPALALDKTTALLCSEVNLHEDEVNVGFECRPSDASASEHPTIITGAILESQLTGVISELTPKASYDYRPFYTSNSGNTYYGDWTTFIAGEDVKHADPTVRTCTASVFADFSVELKGYVLRGSDVIIRQGFQYWSSSDRNDMMEIDVEGQKFTHTLTDLQPSTTYTYRTFVETAGGAFYGDEQSFTTEDFSAVEVIPEDDFEPEIVGYYSLQGVHSDRPFEGLNIVVYSDGSTKKMIIR